MNALGLSPGVTCKVRMYTDSIARFKAGSADATIFDTAADFLVRPRREFLSVGLT